MSQRPFTITQFPLSATSVRVSVCSLNPAAVGLVLDGVAQSNLTLTARGEDGEGGANDSSAATSNTKGGTLDDALYQGSVDLTVTANTDATLVVTQGSDSETYTLRPDTGTGKRFVLWAVTCDGPGSTGEEAAAPSLSSPGFQDYGMYTYIRADMASNPVKGLIHMDDHGYTQSGVTTDTGTGGTGYFIVGRASDRTREYRYLVNYGNYLGLQGYLPDDLTGTGISTDQEQAGWRQVRFIHEDRHYVRQNLAGFFGTGDHEYDGAQGDGARGTALPPDTTDIRAVALAAWKHSEGGALPDYLYDTTPDDLGVTYVHQYGDVQFVFLDRDIGWDGSTVPYDFPNQLSSVELIPLTMVSKILDALDPTVKVTFLCMSADTYRNVPKQFIIDDYDSGDPSRYRGEGGYGAQQPLADYSPDNWFKLMVDGDGTNEGILKQISDAGTQCYYIHGDTHYWRVRAHFIPQGANDVEVKLLNIGMGSVNGQPGQRLATECRSTYRSAEGSTIIAFDTNADNVVRHNTATGLRIECKFDLSPWEIDFKIIDYNGNTLWSTTAKEGEGNIPAALNFFKGHGAAGSLDG